MNDETTALLLDVVARLERSIVDRDCPAIAAIEGRRTLVLSDFDYLRDEAAAMAFERRAAMHALDIEAVRWVFAVPQVWVVTSAKVAARAVSNHPLREGEQEVIAWMSFDRTAGVDYGRVPYTRRPSGEPVFGDAEVFTVGLQPAESMPGHRMLRTVMKAGMDTTDNQED